MSKGYKICKNAVHDKIEGGYDLSGLFNYTNCNSWIIRLDEDEYDEYKVKIYYDFTYDKKMSELLEDADKYNLEQILDSSYGETTVYPNDAIVEVGFLNDETMGEFEDDDEACLWYYTDIFDIDEDNLALARKIKSKSFTLLIEPNDLSILDYNLDNVEEIYLEGTVIFNGADDLSIIWEDSTNGYSYNHISEIDYLEEYEKDYADDIVYELVSKHDLDDKFYNMKSGESFVLEIGSRVTLDIL